MHRRDLLGWLSAGAAAGGLELALQSGPRGSAQAGAGVLLGFSRPAPAEDHRHHDDPHRSQSGPAGHRQGLDQRAGPLRPGLRHVHPARPRRADGRREVPEAVPGRPRRRPDRGYLAVVLRQLVLAERPGAVQRHERRGHGAVGHQGEAGEHARLSTAGRQVPVRRRPLCPRQRARRSRRSRRTPGPRWPGATGISASRSRSRAWRPTAPARRPTCPTSREVDRADQPQGSSGSRALICAPFRSCSSTCDRRSATTSSSSRRPRADHAQPGGQPVQGAGEIPSVLPRGPAAARGEGPLPADPPAIERADRDGRAVQHPAGICAADRRAADRLHPHPHLADRRAEHGTQGRGALRVLRREDRLARARRLLAGGARRRAALELASSQLRHP